MFRGNLILRSALSKRSLSFKPLARTELLRSSNFTRSQFRAYSSQPTGGSSNASRYLTIAGLIAAGVTLYAITSPGKTPAAYIEPESVKEQLQQTSPAFKDGEISVIFVLGGPGAGKGTQCANLVKDYGFVHLSAGDLLRAEQAREGSKYGEMIAQYIRDGLIVPQEVTIALLEQAMKLEVGKGNSKFLIDGFPRKMDQALTFEEKVSKSAFTLFFECPEDVMLKRLLKRGETSGRTDDNVESIKKRFKTFIDTSMPVVDYFNKQDKVVKVSCDSPVDDVYMKVKLALKDKLDLKIQ